MSNSQKKSNDGFATGILFVIIGVIALCVTLFDVSIHWYVMKDLWPLLLIIIGVCVIPINRWIRTGIVVAILIGGAIAYHQMDKNYSVTTFESSSIFKDDDWDFFDETVENQIDAAVSQDDEDVPVQEFSEPFRKNISYAEVEVDYGAGNLKLSSPTSNLIYASNDNKYVRQSFNVKYDGNEADIKFSSDTQNVKNVKKQDGNFVMSLNTKPVWKFDFELGACNVDFDFSEYKVSEIDFTGGVCNVDMKIGTLYENTKIDVESGVSKITIRIPESAGCRIESESALTNKSFDGFRKLERGVYETDNYGSTAQNIVIDLECAVSDINIKRY